MKDADLAAAMDAMGTSEPAAAEEDPAEDAAAAQAERLEKLTAVEGGTEGFPPMDPSASLQDILPDTEEEFGVFLERLVAATNFSAVRLPSPASLTAPNEIFARNAARLAAI